MRWVLGNLIDGSVRIGELRTAAGGEATVDVLNDGEASVDVIIKDTPYENTWAETFVEGQNYVALVDGDDVLFFGVLIRRSLTSKMGMLRLRARQPEELLRSRFVISGSSKITDPDAGREFKGATWSGVMATLIDFWTSTDGLPSNSPRPPQINGSVTRDPGDTRVFKAVYADRLTIDEALNQIADDRTPGGIEWRATPRWASSSQSRIVIDWSFGTDAQPKIGYGTTFNLDLTNESANRTKVSEFEPTTSSEGYFNRIWGQSMPGGGSEDIDLTPKTAGGSNAVLVEHYWSAGVELTDAEMDSHLQARLNAAASGELTLTVNIEEVTNRAQWIARLGNRVVVTGAMDDDRVTMRIASVKVSDKAGTVSLELVTPTVRLPRLPSHGTRNIVKVPGAGTNSDALRFENFGGAGGGGEIPWNPGEPGDGADGGEGIDWGTGGGVPGEVPSFEPASDWESALGFFLDPAFYRGGYCQNNGNIVFSTGQVAGTENMLDQQLVRPAVSPASFDGLESIVASGYLQEGSVLGVRIDQLFALSSGNVNAMLNQAGVSGLWQQPPNFTIYQPFYVSGVSAQTVPEAMVAVGVNLLMPVNFTVYWTSSDLGSQTQNFNVWMMAKYDKDTLRLGTWGVMPGQFESTGYVTTSARAGQWILVTDSTGALRARPVGDTPVFSDWKSYPPPPRPQNTYGYGFAIAGDWKEDNGARYAYADYVRFGGGGGGANMSHDIFYIQLFSAEGSSPLPLEDQEWNLLNPQPGNASLARIFAHQGRLFVSVGDLPQTPDASGNLVDLTPMDGGPARPGGDIGRVLSYRNWIYYRASSSSGAGAPPIGTQAMLSQRISKMPEAPAEPEEEVVP